MNKPLCINLHNIVSNTTFYCLKCRVCITEMEIFGSVQEKNLILRKQPLKICIVIEIYRRK